MKNKILEQKIHIFIWKLCNKGFISYKTFKLLTKLIGHKCCGPDCCGFGLDGPAGTLGTKEANNL